MPIQSGSDKTLKCVGHYEGVRRAMVGMKGIGGCSADADKRGSRQM